MKQRPRRYFTEADKALRWDRWQAGDSLRAMARLFDRQKPLRAQRGSQRSNDYPQALERTS